MLNISELPEEIVLHLLPEKDLHVTVAELIKDRDGSAFGPRANSVLQVEGSDRNIYSIQFLPKRGWKILVSTTPVHKQRPEPRGQTIPDAEVFLTATDKIADLPNTQFKADMTRLAFRTRMSPIVERHQAFVHAVELASEQVQDKRLEFYKEKPDIKTNDFILSLLFIFINPFGYPE